MDEHSGIRAAGHFPDGKVCRRPTDGFTLRELMEMQPLRAFGGFVDQLQAARLQDADAQLASASQGISAQ